MLTPDQLAAQSITPGLTDLQVQNLMLLVKQYPVYIANLGLFPGLYDKLVVEQGTPTIITQGLKAVLEALNELPEVVVESQGRSTAPSHFTTNDNWNSLALDVLNLFYDVPAGVMTRQSFALAYKKLENALQGDDMRTVYQNTLLKF